MKYTRLLVTVLVLFGWLTCMESQVVLQRCDRTNLWTGSNPLSVDSDDKKEGIGSIRFTGTGTDWFAKTFSQVHTGVDETGYLSLWLYVSDDAAFDGIGQIEITSSGGPDVDEYSWSTSSLDWIMGWNELLLPISSATKLGNPDLDAINYFRVYQPLSYSVTAKIDGIKFLKSAAPEPSDDPLDIQPIDFNTLDGKVMFGYQGWFLHPDDGSALARWRHWGRDNTFSPEKITVDMFPDLREYEADELYPSDGFTYADGRRVNVYSAYTKKTVVRHMKWVRDYGLDGVFLQRFIGNTLDASLRSARDTVTANIMDGCERYGRAFANMWDISGFTPERMDIIINDWKHLVDDLGITESSSYLHHRGRPLVAIWGFTVREEFPLSDLKEVMDFFTSESTPEKYRATVMLGVDHDFHKRSASWKAELARADVISPWAVGRFGDDNGQQNFMNEHVLPGQDWCDQNNVDFLPVIWPGFSWANLKNDVPNKRPRRGGNFFWTQANRVISGNAKSIYIAMFDEVDESTAMFKLAENDAQTPDQAYFLALDADGYDLPSDWYLRCAKLATEVVRGNTANRTSLGTPPDGIDAFAAVTVAAQCGSGNGKLELYHPDTPDRTYEFSIDNGASYPYNSTPGTSMLAVEGLSPGIYQVWVRNADGSNPTDLGPYTIFDTEPFATLTGISATCDQGAGIGYLLNDLPYAGEVQFSVDSGLNYDFASSRGIWADTLSELPPGSYSVWIRFEDGSCETELGTVEVSDNLKPVEVYPMLDGVQGAPDTDTLQACPGSSLILLCGPLESEYTWYITGPNGFTANSPTLQVSGSLTPEMFGTYEVSYTRPDGCRVSKDFVLLQDEGCETWISESPSTLPQLEVHPNPAYESIYIQSSAQTSLMLDIADLSGRILKSGIRIEPGPNRVDLRPFTNGLYYLIFSDNEGKKHHKHILKSGRT
jgi:hypothetical protein